MTTSRNVMNFDIRITPTDNRGYGIFTNELIPSGSLIGSNLSKRFSPDLDFSDMQIFQYFFHTPDATTDRDGYTIVCGEFLFLNHSDSPNARVDFRASDSGLLFADLTSLSNIVESEEITIRYADIDRYHSSGLI